MWLGFWSGTNLAERDEEEGHLRDELAELGLGGTVLLDGEYAGGDLLDGGAGLGEEVVGGAWLRCGGGAERTRRCLDVHGFRRRHRCH